MSRVCARAVFTTAALSLCLSAGCRDAEVKLTPVEGNIKVGGKPLESGNITFHPDADKGNSHAFAQPPVGSVVNGSYSMSTNGKPGAPVGWYKVTVNASVPSDPKDEYSVPKLLVDKAYTDPATTTLTLEVKEEAPPGTYDLKLAN